MTTTIEYSGVRFALGAAEKAKLHEDAEGAMWRVPVVGGGYFETTDEGLAIIRNRLREADNEAFLASEAEQA